MSKWVIQRKILNLSNFNKSLNFNVTKSTNLNCYFEQILGRETKSGRISKRKWEAIVSHAMQCVLDETERYIYNANALDGSLIFNSVYEVIKVSLSDGTFRNPDEVPTYQLDKLKKEAYRDLTLLKTFVEHPQRSLQCTPNPGYGIACPELQHNNFLGIQVYHGRALGLLICISYYRLAKLLD